MEKTIKENVKEGALYAARRKSATETLPLEAVEARKERYGNSSTRNSEDNFIAERVEVIVQKLHVTLGIIDGCYPTIFWHMGPLADVKWITSDRKFPPGVKNLDC